MRDRERDTVLLVMPHASSRETLGLLLQGVFNVVSFSLSADGLRYAQGHTLAAAVVSFEQPMLSGPSLAKELKAIDPHLSVILTTTHVKLESLQQAVGDSVSRILKLPSQVEFFQEAVGEAVAATKANRHGAT